MVGSLKLVGEGPMGTGALEAALAARTGAPAAPWRPPHGLYLVRVDY